ncbi:MAG: fibronectin type III domain-containing protein, partial [Candidatus Eisenbacteria bacterium]|nr:fibronectin type III domain-containing protein [Candidatus Eisenbacteria bacterium]
GLMDDLRLYARVLTGAEIEAFHLAGPPLAPSGLSAMATGLTTVELTWDDNAESDVTAYNVYRSETPGFAVGPASLIASPASSSYVDAPVTAGVIYYYRVTVTDGTTESAPSPEAEALGLSSGLVGHWRLGETSGTVAADSSGNGNAGTLSGADFVDCSVAGAIGGAVHLDGTGDIITIGNEPVFDIGGQITVAAWIKVNSFTAAWQAIVTKGDSAWRVARNDSLDTLKFNCNGLAGATGVVSATSVADGEWHHVAGVYDGSSLRIYVDGLLDALAVASGSIAANDFPVVIGANAEMDGREWGGDVDDVRVYDRALSAGEVALLYGQAGDSTPPAAPTGLVASSVVSNTVTLEWDENSEADLAGYSVYRSMDASPAPSGLELLASDLILTSYVDSSGAGSTAYHYAVTATDTAENVSALSGSVRAVTGPDTAPPETPSGVVAVPASSVSVHLEWNAAPDEDVAGYSVYGATEADFVPCVSTVLATYTHDAQYKVYGLSPNTMYHFVVLAFDYSGNTSDYSSVASCTTPGDLLLHWALDDSAGSTASDSSGHGRDGNVLGDPAWNSAGAVGGALTLDGSDNYVEDPDGHSYLNGLTAITIAVWVKPSIIDIDRGFIAAAGADGHDEHLTLRLDPAGLGGGGTNVIKAGIATDQGDVTVESSSGTVRAGEWQHFAMAWSSGETLTIYVNGKRSPLSYDKSGGEGLLGSIAGCTRFAAGVGTRIPTPILGEIDDVRVFDRGLLAGDIEALYLMGPPAKPAGLEITPVGMAPAQLCWLPNSESDLDLYSVFRGDTHDFVPSAANLIGTTTDSSYTDSSALPDSKYHYKVSATDTAGKESAHAAGTMWELSDGLVAYYRFDDSAATGVDSSGNGNDLVAAGPTWSENGKVRAAISFDGNSDSADTPLGTMTSQRGSLSLWFKGDTDFADRVILYYGSPDVGGNGFGTQKEMHLGFDTSERLVFFLEGTPYVQITSNSVCADGRWHHAVATWDVEAGICLFVDGELVGTQAHNGRTYAFSACHRLGAPYADERHYGGVLDEVRLYDRALGRHEVAALGRFVEFERPASNSDETVSPAKILVVLSWTPTAAVDVEWSIAEDTGA